MTAVSDLIVARSQVVIRTGIYAELAAADVPIEGLQSTSILRALPEITAALEASGEEARVSVTKGGYVSGAESLAAPEWLNLHGEDFFQLTRDEAVRTAGTFRIAASATASATTIGTGKLVVRAGTVRFESIEPFTPSPGGAVNVRMRAQIAGIAGNIATGALLVLVTSYPGLTATNPAVSGGTSWITTRGRNAEAQKSYAGRLRARWADLGPQTTEERFAALVRAAYTSAGLTPVVTRVWADTSNPLGPGSVALYLATDTAPASAEDVALVEAYVAPRWASGAGRLRCHAAMAYEIAVTGTIKGPTIATVALAEATDALDVLAATYPIGGATAYLEQRRAALMSGVNGAVNVVLVGQDDAIPPGGIVAFTPISLQVIP
jgi:hypothetical protein